MFPFILSLLLLANIWQTTALALSDRSQHPPNTALLLEKRQGAAIVTDTKFSTIFIGGDATKTRTANPGFDCRVDVPNRLWGFCPTTVIVASDCGLAGSCVDSFSCSKGCGFTDSPLTTFTCNESHAPFCSTALLTISDLAGRYTYIACGGGPSTDEYHAFTTNGLSAPIPRPRTSTSPAATQEATFTLAAATETTSNSGSPSPSNTATPDSDPDPSSGPGSGPDINIDNNQSQSQSSSSSNNNNNNPPNNTAAIIGGTVGCLALLCGCAVVIYWLRQRSRKGAETTALAAKSAGMGDAGRGSRLSDFKLFSGGKDKLDQASTVEGLGAYYRGGVGVAVAELSVGERRVAELAAGGRRVAELPG